MNCLVTCDVRMRGRGMLKLWIKRGKASSCQSNESLGQRKVLAVARAVTECVDVLPACRSAVFCAVPQKITSNANVMSVCSWVADVSVVALLCFKSNEEASVV